MAKIQALVSDLDGVLVDSESLHQEAERNILAQYGVVVTKDDVHSVVGLSAHDVFNMILANHGKSTEFIEEMIKEKRRIFWSEYIPKIELFPGALDLVCYLAPRIKLGLATSSPADYQQNIFRKFGLERYFSAIVTSTDVRNTKPHPEPYLLAMSRLNADPLETLVIEDSTFGVRSGKSAGATVIAVTHTLPGEKLMEADHIVDSLYEANELIEKYI